MVKTCQIESCDGNVVETNDILFSPDSKTIKKVSGEVLINLPLDLKSISQRLDEIEQIIHSYTDESPFSEMEKELNNIRDLIKEIEENELDINSKIENLQNLINQLNKNFATNENLQKLIDDYNSFKSNINSELNVNKVNIQSNLQKINELQTNIDDIIKKINNNANNIQINAENIKKLQDELTNFENTINSEIDKINLKLNTNISDNEQLKPLFNKGLLETGGFTFKNINIDGKYRTIIKFNSYVNYNSDYGYIEYDDDNDTYALWGNSDENSALIIGVENDVQNSVSDVVALKSPAGVFIDAPDLFIKNGTTFEALKNYVSNFTNIKVTYGRLQTQNRYSNSNNLGVNNFNYNYAYVYPPSGYTINDLIGFLPSIAEVFYNGEVDSNDTIYCDWKIDGNRIKITANNSENRANSYVNFIALWRKG